MAPHSSLGCHACPGAHPDVPPWSLRQNSLHTLLKGTRTPACARPHRQRREGARLGAAAGALPSPSSHRAPLLASVSPCSTVGLRLLTPWRGALGSADDEALRPPPALFPVTDRLTL